MKYLSIILLLLAFNSHAQHKNDLPKWSVTEIVSSSTPTPTGDAKENWYKISDQSVDAAFQAPSGKYADNNKLMIKITSIRIVKLRWDKIYYATPDLPLPLETSKLYTTQILYFLYKDGRWNLFMYVFNVPIK